MTNSETRSLTKLLRVSSTSTRLYTRTSRMLSFETECFLARKGKMRS